MTAMPSIAAALAQATAALGGSSSPRLDAEVLLAAALGVARTALYRAPERCLEPASAARYSALVAARARGVPVAYLIGQCEFWSLTLEVTTDVLVPRPDTETLVEVALELSPPDRPQVVVDLGTGSGAIAAALAHERPLAQVVATDLSAAALALAKRNLARLGLARVALVRGDWLSPLDSSAIDLVVANPPYVGTAESDRLGPELAFEPPAALFAGHDGLAALDTLIAQAGRGLKRGAWLAVEHGAGQGEAVLARFATHGFVTTMTRRDLAGRARVTCGRRG